MLQSNLMDTESLVSQKNVIDIFQKIIHLKDPFTIYIKIFQLKKLLPHTYLYFVLYDIFLILNYSLFHKYIKKILS